MNILVIGLTSVGLGGMEYHNLGNYIIIDPFFQLLRKTFPSAEIKTSIQMSEKFNNQYNIISLREKRFWSYGVKTAKHTMNDIFKFFLWRITKKESFLKYSLLLSELNQADLIIDFSGDIYGDNANWRAFLESNAHLFFAKKFNKKTAMIIGSPGAFKKAWRRIIAKYILSKLDLITNREEISTHFLKQIYRINNNNIHTTACPSVLFQGGSIETLSNREDYSLICDNSKRTVGLILCGWNMPVGPYNKWPREDWEFQPFIKLINYIYDSSNYRICLMSHQNATDIDYNLIAGNDHKIIEKLYDLISDDKKNRVITLNGLYAAEESKAIIGTFDVLISGRIHGAVQGISQTVPTAIIDYGHEPKAHKLRGFAKMYGIEKYVCDPLSGDDLIFKFNELIKYKSEIKSELIERVGFVKKEALKNFELLKELVES